MIGGGRPTNTHRVTALSVRGVFRGLVVLSLCYVPMAGSLGDPASPSAVALDDATRRVALVVGNANYRSLVKLDNAANDGQDVCAALSKLGFEVACHANVPQRKDFREAVRRFASSLAPRTAAFFYYAGHGVQINGENYLLPTDIDPHSAADIEDEGLSLSYLLRLIEEARSAPSIIVLDACRDNPFSTRNQIALTKGLARIDPPVGTVMVYATAPNRAALDGQGRNGLFTKHLLAHLATPGLKLDELLQIVAKGVEDEARTTYKFEQVPYRNSSFTGVFCPAGCTNPQLDEKLAQISRQAEEASRRMKELAEENARLRTQAADRASMVARLESRIGELSSDAGQSGARRTQIEKEIERLRADLEKARSRQTEDRRLEQDIRERDTELLQLRSRFAELQKQAQQIEEYRKQIQELKKEKEEQAKLLESRSRSADKPQAERRKPGVIVPNF